MSLEEWVRKRLQSLNRGLQSVIASVLVCVDSALWYHSHLVIGAIVMLGMMLHPNLVSRIDATTSAIQ